MYLLLSLFLIIRFMNQRNITQINSQHLHTHFFISCVSFDLHYMKEKGKPPINTNVEIIINYFDATSCKENSSEEGLPLFHFLNREQFLGIGFL